MKEWSTKGNGLRMSFNKYSSSNQSQARFFAMQVEAPVIQQYNHIDLRKHMKNKRIDHLILKKSEHLPAIIKSNSNDLSQRQKWEKSLDRYIEAKQKIQNKKASLNGDFTFLKLDKINKYRKKKLVQANSLPISIINSTDLNQSYSFQLQQPKSRILKNKEQEKRYSTQDDLNMAVQNQGKWNEEINQEKPAEKLLNHILNGYFKKKVNSLRQNTGKKLPFHSSFVLKNKRKLGTKDY